MTGLFGLMAILGAGAFPTVVQPRGAATAQDEVAPPEPVWALTYADGAEQVDRWTERFSGINRPVLQEDLSRGSSYTWLIAREIERRGLPLELAALPIIESQYLPRARSKAEAVGLWQLVEETARASGLRVDEWVDERRDPVRSTQVALDYVVHLQQRFGDWPLILAAYNAGPSRVAAWVAYGERVGLSFQDLLGRLPAETQAYVPKAIAAAQIFRSPSDFGLRLRPGRPYRYETVWVPPGTSLRRVADLVGEPVDTLQWLNPHLLRGVTPPDAFWGVRVPVTQASAVVAGLMPGQAARWAD